MKYSKIAQLPCRKGGINSAKSRLGGLTKEQKNKLMRKVQLGKESTEDKKRLVKYLTDVG